MTQETDDLVIAHMSFPPDVEGMAYVLEVEVNGVHGWALFNCFGDLEFFHPRRSSAYFYAADHDIRVVTVH